MQLSLIVPLVAAILATGVSAQTPPNFNVSATTNLPFSFNGMSISAGQNLQYLVSRNDPTVLLPESLDADATYLLLMVDPDVPSPLAPSSRAEILHWLQPNVQAASAPDNLTLTPSVPAIAGYNPPQPPSLEPHRYILLLYTQEQPEFQVPEGFEGFNEETRQSFDALTFQERAGLGSPVAASWFLTGNNGTNVTFTGTGTGGMPSQTGGQQPVQTGFAPGMAVGWAGVLGAAGLMAAAMV